MRNIANRNSRPRRSTRRRRRKCLAKVAQRLAARYMNLKGAASKQTGSWKDVLEAAVTAIQEKAGEQEDPNYTGKGAKSGSKGYKPQGEEKGGTRCNSRWQKSKE